MIYTSGSFVFVKLAPCAHMHVHTHKDNCYPTTPFVLYLCVTHTHMHTYTELTHHTHRAVACHTHTWITMQLCTLTFPYISTTLGCTQPHTSASLTCTLMRGDMCLHARTCVSTMCRIIVFYFLHNFKFTAKNISCIKIK